MKRILILAALAIVLLGGGYYYYRNQDQQLINRQVDVLIENIEHKKISLRKPSDVEKAIREVMTDQVLFHGSFPVPRGELSVDDVLERLSTFHGLTTSCEIRESDRKVLIKENEAQVTIDAEIAVAAGKNLSRKEKWTMVFTLSKSDVWRISGVKGIPPNGATSDEDAEGLF